MAVPPCGRPNRPYNTESVPSIIGGPPNTSGQPGETVFSPGGQLQQVLFAQEATRKCSTVVGVCGDKCVVLGIEKRLIEELQIERTARKIHKVDDNIALAFAGLTADARVLIERAIAESQSHRLVVESPISVFGVASYLGTLKHKYTQSIGMRPFGVSCLIGGFDEDGSPHLYQTDPSGNYNEWKANAIGRSGQTLLHYFEKIYKVGKSYSINNTIKIALKGLLAIARSQNIELAVLEFNKPMKILTHQEVMHYAEDHEED